MIVTANHVSDPKRFDPAEEAALAKNDSTSTILNKARRDAGFKEPDVAVRADDPTLNAFLEAKKTHLASGEIIGATTHALDIAGELGLFSKAGLTGTGVAGATGTLMTVGCVALPVVGFVAGQVAMSEMQKQKTDMRDAATRDQLRGALVATLEVPTGFKQKEIRELGVAMTAQSAATKIASQLETTDKALKATLQLHCDQGMTAACDQLAGGQDRKTFFATHPAVAERYQADVAFKMGFDAVQWAKNEGEGTFTSTVEGLHARDARYEAAHVAVRI